MPQKRVLSSSDEDVYHVEVITNARVNDDAEWEYLVSWAGYPSSEDSWEPAENVEQCDRLLRSFWKHVGMDNEDYTPGDQFNAQKWWIARERQFFADEWRAKDKKKKKASKDRHYAFTISGAGPSGSKKSEKDPNKALQEFVRQQNDTTSDGSEGSDDVPLSKTLVSKSKSKGKARPAQRRKIIQPQNDSDMHVDDWTLTGAMPSKGKRSIGAPGTSTTRGARPSKPIRGNKRLRLSSPGDKDTFSDTTISQPIIVTEPATPTRRLANQNHDDSPSSLFSAPSSPAHMRPIQPAAPEPPSLSIHTSLGATTTGPKKPPPPRPTGSVRKPTWFLEPKIKRFDAPNLKPGSSLPTKANLGVVRASDIAQPSTSGRRDSIQSPIGMSSPRTPSTLEGGAAFEPGSNADAQRQGSVPQLAGVQSPVQDTPRAPPASMADTEAFLNDFMPTEMSEPMIDGVEPSRSPSIPIHRPSVSDLLKKTSIPRKFKWSGELRINTEKDHKERLCNVTLSDVTDGSAARLRFSICFTPSVSFLLLEKLFTLGELECLRPALTPVAEIAKLGPETPADEKLLSSLFLHMSSRKLLSFSNIYIDDNRVALLLVFPVSNLVLCKEYNVRQDLRKAGHFITALLPWKVVGIKARTHRLFRDPCDGTHDTLLLGKMESIVMARQGHTVRKDPSYHRDLSVLGFPKWLYDEMAESRYCIWNKDGDGSPNGHGFETRALIHVLDERRATNKGLKADVDFVFVHVGAIKTLNQLPALMERRMKRLDIQFVTYGTHHTIPPARWGIRHIYPAGGIVTFSPSAFAECPSTTYRLLDMLEQHPLWDCFVTPGVVALTARQRQGSDPVSEFEKGTLIHQDLLSRIGQGQLSLLSMEPPHYGPKEGPLVEWICRHQETSMLEPRGILEDCLRSFNKHFSELPEEKWSFNVLTELLSMLFSLQMQPCMMDHYRRFVVITGKQDKIAPDRGGFEWTNIDGFNFRDDFFSKEKTDDLRTWATVEQKTCDSRPGSRDEWLVINCSEVNAPRPAHPLFSTTYNPENLRELKKAQMPMSAALQAILDDPRYHDYLAILKGARNGLVYGFKVRFPHALIMAILFGRGDWHERFRVILRASKQHATNLAKFVAIYKSLLLLQRKLNGGKGRRQHDTFFAGLLGGYVVFGERNAINEQIVLYVCSRVLASFIPRARSPHAPVTTGSGNAVVKPLPPDSRYFSVFAAITWGAVMWLFQHRGETIQPGMFNSMTYLYRDSERWQNLRTLLWHNR